MSAKWQRESIKIPKIFNQRERVAISNEILKFIRNRSKNAHVDKNGKPFPKYTKAYENSLDFKNAGKSKGVVNITLSGDTLAAMGRLAQKPGEILIGFKNGSTENAIADGNIRGTYGSSSEDASKKRDFLGIEQKDLDKIIGKFATDKLKTSKVASTLRIAKELARGKS